MHPELHKSMMHCIFMYHEQYHMKCSQSVLFPLSLIKVTYR